MKEKQIMKRCDKCDFRLSFPDDRWRRMETANGKDFSGTLRHKSKNVDCGGTFVALVSTLVSRAGEKA